MNLLLLVFVRCCVCACVGGLCGVCVLIQWGMYLVNVLRWEMFVVFLWGLWRLLLVVVVGVIVVVVVVVVAVVVIVVCDCCF